MNHIDTYDKEKLEKAIKLIDEVYEYNYKSESDMLGKRLLSAKAKLEGIIDKHYVHVGRV